MGFVSPLFDIIQIIAKLKISAIMPNLVHVLEEEVFEKFPLQLPIWMSWV